jgi:protein-tyrosine phosphatase
VQTVCAYLMATEGLTPDQALAALRKKHRVASPNAGFMAQLRLFHQMHCKCAPFHRLPSTAMSAVWGPQRLPAGA